MTEMMEWMSNFDEEIGRWIEEIDFGDIMAGAQQTEIQHTDALAAPPTEEAIPKTGEQQPPHTEAEMDYALRAISLVQQALPLMNEAFRVKTEAQDKEIAQLKQAVARLEAERNARPTSPRVVIDNRGRDTATRAKRPRAQRKKGTESQEEARRAHRALNAKKWRAKRKEEERQKEAGDARKRGLRRSDRTLIVLDD